MQVKGTARAARETKGQRGVNSEKDGVTRQRETQGDGRTAKEMEGQCGDRGSK